MSFDPKLKASEILALAIRAEIEASGLYAALKEKVKNELLKEKLKFLEKEEIKHRRLLERVYSQRFPGIELKIPQKSFLKPLRISIDKKTSIRGLFLCAQEGEKKAEDFYRKGATKIKDRDSKRILIYLSRVERSHYFMIKSELDLLEKFPDYYDVENFHFGQDMFHIGP